MQFISVVYDRNIILYSPYRMRWKLDNILPYRAKNLTIYRVAEVSPGGGSAHYLKKENKYYSFCLIHF